MATPTATPTLPDGPVVDYNYGPPTATPILPDRPIVDYSYGLAHPS